MTIRPQHWTIVSWLETQLQMKVVLYLLDVFANQLPSQLVFITCFSNAQMAQKISFCRFKRHQLEKKTDFRIKH